MARRSKIANRYAQALFDFSQEQGILEEVERDMVILAEVISSHRELQLMLASPVILKSRKISILHAIFEPRFHVSTLTFIKIIVNAGREKYLDGMAIQFKELYKVLKGIMTVHLKSAAPIHDDLKAEIAAWVKEASGSDVEIEEQVLPALIGGFILEYDNKQIDASLLSRFERLRKDFKINRYIRDI